MAWQDYQNASFPMPNNAGMGGYELQQNWQQWMQWQHQYAQWHSQYGDKYAAQMAAIQSMPDLGAQFGQNAMMPNMMPAPPPPDTSQPPPPPPPPPPHENDLPLYGQPKPSQQPAQQGPSNNTNSQTHQTGNTQNWSYDSTANNDPTPNAQSVHSEALRKLADEERVFDIEFKKWEHEIETWKKDNINHPDKQAYKEYEEKYEACRVQLLQRRELMQQRKRKLLEKAGDAPAAARAPAAASAPTAYADYNSYQNHRNVSQQYDQNNVQTVHSNSQRDNNKNVEPQDRYDSYNSNDEFLPTISGNNTIPGLDLVSEEKNIRQSDVIEIDDDKQEQEQTKEPDYSKISLGINSILGDEKIMNMLSMVANKAQNQDNACNNTNNTYNRGQDNRQNYAMNNQGNFNNQQAPPKQFMQGQHQAGHPMMDTSKPPPMQQNYGSFAGPQNQRNTNQPLLPNPDRQNNRNFGQRQNNQMQFNQNSMSQNARNPRFNQNGGQQNDDRNAYNLQDFSQNHEMYNHGRMPQQNQIQNQRPQNQNQRQNHQNEMQLNQRQHHQNEMHLNQNIRHPNQNEMRNAPMNQQRNFSMNERNNGRPLLTTSMDQPGVPEPPQPVEPEQEDVLFTPSIIVDYDHEPLRIGVRNFIVPVVNVEYDHVSLLNKDQSRGSAMEDIRIPDTRRIARESERRDSRELDHRVFERRPREERLPEPPEDRYRERDSRLGYRRTDDRLRHTRREEERERPREMSRFRLDRREGSAHSRESESRKSHTPQERSHSPHVEPKRSKNVVMIDDILEHPGREMRPSKILIILRGLPGSGKSYLAKLIKDRESENGGSARIMSIDDYFMQDSEVEEVDQTGRTVKKLCLKYEYDPVAEKSYLTSLKKSVKKTITDGYFNFLIYDAVNETIQSFAEVMDYAKHNSFRVYLCSMEADPQACFKRNVHGRSLADISAVCERFEPTPGHLMALDAATLLQRAAITEVHMEDATEDISEQEQSPEDEVESSFTSKWEKMDDANQLARLDGTSRPLRSAHLSMVDYLQLDEWQPTQSKPGKKTVRWADIEERRNQEKMRAIGFVVGQTDWNRMTDPTMGSSALTQTKYIERVKRN